MDESAFGPGGAPAHAASRLSFVPSETEPSRLYKLVAGLVVPRPIALVSTVSREGRRNLAPFSWFNALSADTPYLCISIGRHAGRSKDTLDNILATGEFVINLVNETIAEQQDACANEYPAEVDEFDVTGLRPLASTHVRPPGVAESRACFECRVSSTIALPRSEYTVVIGEAVAIHVDEAAIDERGRIDMAALGNIGRLAGRQYCRIADTFSFDHDAFSRFKTGG